MELFITKIIIEIPIGQIDTDLKGLAILSKFQSIVKRICRGSRESLLSCSTIVKLQICTIKIVSKEEKRSLVLNVKATLAEKQHKKKNSLKIKKGREKNTKGRD